MSGVTTKARAIVCRTRGRTHGPITRLVSPGDLGELLDGRDLVAIEERFVVGPVRRGAFQIGHRPGVP